MPVEQSLFCSHCSVGDWRLPSPQLLFLHVPLKQYKSGALQSLSVTQDANVQVLVHHGIVEGLPWSHCSGGET